MYLSGRNIQTANVQMRQKNFWSSQVFSDLNSYVIHDDCNAHEKLGLRFVSPRV